MQLYRSRGISDLNGTHVLYLSLAPPSSCLTRVIISFQASMPKYKYTSDDELAFVMGARRIGCELVETSPGHKVVHIHGHNTALRVLNIVEFTPERQRMTVAVQVTL